MSRPAVPRRPSTLSARDSVPMPACVVAAVAGSALGWVVTGDWIAAAAVWLLFAAWHWLRGVEPVLPLAFTYQWVQVTVGLYYAGLTGTRLPAMDYSDYRPMVLLGLGCLAALLVGLKLGLLVGPAPRAGSPLRPERAFTWGALIGGYAILLVLTGPVQVLAWEVPALTQAILALTYFRFAMLFMMFWWLLRRRQGRWWIALLLAVEIGFGLTGYFAGFREPLMMVAVALLGTFDARSVKHWTVLIGLVVVMCGTGLMWLSIRTGYRQEFESEVFANSRVVRAERLVDLSSAWLTSDLRQRKDDLDLFVERLWVIYYPALAVTRVPSVLPHENGALLWRAIEDTVFPRFLFPDKGVLPSDSEMVVRYSGVWVAGAEQNTSVAFGYAAESYVDFGVPLMFLPVLLWGLVLGVMYRVLLSLIRHRDLGVAVVTVVFWLSLYLFERSWAKSFGTFAILTVYLGGATLVCDRVLLAWRDKHRQPPGRAIPGGAPLRPGARPARRG